VDPSEEVGQIALLKTCVGQKEGGSQRGAKVPEGQSQVKPPEPPLVQLAPDWQRPSQQLGREEKVTSELIIPSLLITLTPMLEAPGKEAEGMAQRSW